MPIGIKLNAINHKNKPKRKLKFILQFQPLKKLEPQVRHKLKTQNFNLNHF